MAWFAAKSDLDRLVTEHYAALYRFAFRLTGRVGEAEDLTQEAFCQAQAKLHQLREAGAARGWLFAILRNAYLHRLRSMKGVRLVSLDDLGEVPDRDDFELPEIDSAQLQRALDLLPESFRTPVVLFYFEDFTYREIAEQMQVPVGTVMSRLARAKEHLRDRLSEPALVADAIGDGEEAS
jgi:RNA polymerase sigma-70 factor (ECF subfamily)